MVGIPKRGGALWGSLSLTAIDAARARSARLRPFGYLHSSVLGDLSAAMSNTPTAACIQQLN